MGWELATVEKPFVEQLLTMGWRYVEGDLDVPARTGRASFSEVIQEATLRHQLHALNLGPTGQPWLDDERLTQAVGAITRIPAHRLMEANHAATELLLGGLRGVEGLPIGMAAAARRSSTSTGSTPHVTNSPSSTNTEWTARRATRVARRSSCPTWCCW